ncbi:SH2 domain-containing adapter protein E [Leuresthes tenuis]|uniref:SH2 domain-containing adapter protein E n=1 Tax=Leuresthes tenuis TaxID=355514 RepID=UPI003B50D79C
MAKWFRDFPINLKNGTERVRSASESGPQTRPKPSFSRDSLKGNQRKDGGVGGLLAGRNRKNSASELGRNNTGYGGTVWDSLTTGKGRKNSKTETGASDENRQVRTSSLAQAYISRMIKVDKQDKTPKLNGITEQKLPENEKGRPDIKTTLIILEDYADPFDAEKTKEQREAERAGVNDGYMEPYDAQVIITEVRRRGSKDLLKVCVLLDRGQTEGKGEEGTPSPPNIYDTPYEGGLEGDSEGVWIPVTRPESDVRPAGEYELPWEWRKEDIVRALSAQFEAVDCSPTKENASTSGRQQQQQQQQQQQTLRQRNWSHKTLVSTSASTSSSQSFPSSPILKLSPLTSSSPSFPTLKLSPLSPSPSPTKLSPPSPTSNSAPLDVETGKMDCSLPLEKQSWYHGSVSRQQAEAQLQRCREASFLVRDSESGTSKYSIALKTSQSCVHIIVAQTKSCKGLGYTLDQSSCVFSSIPELVYHYCTHRLPFTGAEHMTLQHPVPRPH